MKSKYSGEKMDPWELKKLERDINIFAVVSILNQGPVTFDRISKMKCYLSIYVYYPSRHLNPCNKIIIVIGIYRVLWIL